MPFSLDNETRLSEEKLKQQAEQFLEDHYQGALRDFLYSEMEWMEAMFGYTRQQKAMGLQLPETGEYCILDKAVYTDGDDQVHLFFAPRSRGLIYTASSQEEVPTAYRAEVVPSGRRTLDEWPGEFPLARNLE
ncbi:YcdB/YcdC domain-containing protein [Paenibacillus taichungensis]|uniref:YcdB/YcdC domain-containing protein n=2 Tax=Paenibacillus TaxID=44249 RepID=UPI003826C06C